MKKIFKSFFYSYGKFNPAKAWITNFLFIISIIMIIDMLGIREFSDERILGLLGFTLGWIGVYSWYRKGRHENNKDH